MSACVCGAPEPCGIGCGKHGAVLHGWPCEECQREWREANPRTTAAIARFAAGKASKSAVDQARRADAAHRLAQQPEKQPIRQLAKEST